MDGARESWLSTVDEGKRDFLKKLALGTAYAVPVLATFSLDSVRSGARAQTYSPPTVLSFRAVLANGGDLVHTGPPPEYNGTNGPFYWVITYDRPMDPAYASAKTCELVWMVDDFACNPTSVPEPGACGNCPDLTWEWNADKTQERAAVETDDGTTWGQRLYLWLNHSSCPADKLYRDTDGVLLAPFLGAADLCQEDV